MCASRQRFVKVVAQSRLSGLQAKMRMRYYFFISLLDFGSVQLSNDGAAVAAATARRRRARRRSLHEVLAELRQLLDEQLEHVLRQRALQHVEQLGGLAAHDHRVRQMLHALLDLALLQVRLAHLHLLQEEPLHRLLVAEVRERGLGGARGALLLARQHPPLAQVRLEVRVAAPLPVEVQTVSHEAEARDAGRRGADRRLRHFSLQTTKHESKSSDDLFVNCFRGKKKIKSNDSTYLQNKQENRANSTSFPTKVPTTQ